MTGELFNVRRNKFSNFGNVNYLIGGIDITVELVGCRSTASGLVRPVIWLFRTLSDYNGFRDYSSGVSTNAGVNANRGLSRRSFVERPPPILCSSCVSRRIVPLRTHEKQFRVQSLPARNN